jgi:hypothetical protein
MPASYDTKDLNPGACAEAKASVSSRRVASAIDNPADRPRIAAAQIFWHCWASRFRAGEPVTLPMHAWENSAVETLPAATEPHSDRISGLIERVRTRASAFYG